MNRRMLRCAIPVFLLIFLFAPPAHANVMIPIIVGGWFCMFLALVPIILIEWLVLTRNGTHIWESLLAVSVGNLSSTLAGIPLAIVLEIGVATNTRLYDDSWEPEVTQFSRWTLPLGGALLLIPFFLMSWWIEATIVAWFLDDLPVRLVDSTIRDANLVTYGLLAVLLFLLLALSVRDTQLTAASAKGRDNRPEGNATPVDPRVFANTSAKSGMIWLRGAEFRVARRMEARTQAMAARVNNAERDQAA